MMAVASDRAKDRSSVARTGKVEVRGQCMAGLVLKVCGRQDWVRQLRECAYST